ncbi:MAG: hypothetical protein DRJ13_09420 [Bacteroidetes bacterium]|nr:MAG: hypothetical protein DRJ13_09420 [Bacteroidota bacterium]
MDEKKVLQKFRRQKIITLDQLVKLLTCSVITARRRLKKWQTYTSINKNGRYYALPQIPVFDENDLWWYQTVLFSKHGNLTQTIVELIRASEKGLSAVEIAGIVDLAPNSSFLSRIKDVPGIRREKHQGRFIYLSERPEIYNQQKYRWTFSRSIADFPTDAQAIIILVQLIKHPGIGIEQLAGKVAKQDGRIDPGAVRRLLQFHGLLKKTAAIKR